MLERIHWLGHASFRINGSPEDGRPVVYIDPWRIPADSPPADLILISHEHHDHCSPDDIQRIHHDKALIIGNRRVADVLAPLPVRVLRPWQAAMSLCGGAAVRAVPAYTPGQAYHDRAFGGLGFVVSVARMDVYFAGDTALIPEMHKIGCDVALLPVGGTFTMDYEAAVEAAKRIRPHVAVPMHYGREVPGSRENGRHFVQLMNNGIRAVELPVENEHVYAG